MAASGGGYWKLRKKYLSIRKSGHSSASDDKLIEVVYLEVRCYSKETNLKKEIKKRKKTLPRYGHTHRYQNSETG